MSSNCSHECSSCEKSCILKESLAEGSSVKKVIGIVSGKGGVGKSTVTSMLAVAANRMGLRTAVLDADITGPSIPKAFGITEKATGDDKYLYPSVSRGGVQIMSMNLLLESDTQPVIWRGPVIAGVLKQFWNEVLWKDVDVMFVDMPPGTGDVPLTVYQSLPLDGIIVVTTPQQLVSMIVEKAVNMAEKMNIPVLGVVSNMSYFVCPDCSNKHYIFGKTDRFLTDMREKNIPTAELPMEENAAKMCDEGRIEEYNGKTMEIIKEFFEKNIK